MSFVKRQAERRIKTANLVKRDIDLPALEIERARLFSEFGSNWVREYWRRHPDEYLQPKVETDRKL